MHLVGEETPAEAEAQERAYDQRNEVTRAIAAHAYRLLKKYPAHHAGLVLVREILTSYPYNYLPLPKGFTPTQELELNGNRVYYMLMRSGIKCVELLLTMTEGDLLDIRNFGATSLVEVKQALAKRGLELKQL